MKINYNGFRPMAIPLDEIVVSQCFEYETYYYMKIEIDCANFEYQVRDVGLRPIVNLHSGTVRLIDRHTCVWPLAAKCSLRQGHTHEVL